MQNRSIKLKGLKLTVEIEEFDVTGIDDKDVRNIRQRLEDMVLSISVICDFGMSFTFSK